MFKVNDFLFDEKSKTLEWYDGPLVFITESSGKEFFIIYSKEEEYIVVPYNKNHENIIDLHEYLSNSESCYLIKTAKDGLIENIEEVKFEDIDADCKPKKGATFKMEILY